MRSDRPVVIGSCGLSAVLLLTCLAMPAGAQTRVPTSEINVGHLLKETQQTLVGKTHTVVVLWVPVEFWEAIKPSAAGQFEPLREYTTIIAAVGKMGPSGINWVDAESLRANVVLRDGDEKVYAPLESVSPEVQQMRAIMKSTFTRLLAMGENLQVFFFPAKSEKGKLLADPRQPGRFSITIRPIAGLSEQVFEWKLPLTSLSPPKHCPVGKERVEANWNYCPWHGNPLPGSDPARPQPQ